MNETVIRVSADSTPNRVAGAIAKAIRGQQSAEARAIGPNAVNQMVKAIALAQRYVAPEAIQIYCVPSFVDVIVDGDVRTAVSLRLVSSASDGVLGVWRDSIVETVGDP